jgi:MFS family permease
MLFMASVIETLRGNFSPLRNRNFAIYLAGQCVSLIGTWLQSTAQAWVVWDLTNSEAALGTVTMLNALPVLFLSPWAGVWADRFDRRKLLIAAQTAMMALAFILAFLTQSGLVQLWHVYLLSLLLGIVTALDLPAQQAFLGDLTGMGEVRKAVNLNIMALQISRVLGPALAGIVVARLGSAPAFWVNGISFLAVIASLVVVRANQVRNKNQNHDSPLRQLGQAIRYLGTQPRMQDLYLFGTLMTFFVFSIIMNVLPSVADKLLDGNAETLGQLMAASGAGALISVLIVVPLAQARKRVGLVLLGGSFWLVLWLWVFSLSRSLPFSMLAIFLGSMGAPAVMTMGLGLVQVMSPADMRGRMLSLFSTISFGMQPVAAIWIGQVAERLGVAVAIEINATLLFLAAVSIYLFRPALRQWEFGVPAKPAPPAPAVPAPVEPAPSAQVGDR